MTSKRKSTKKRDPSRLEIQGKPGDCGAKLLAQTALRPTVQGAVTVQQYGKKFGELDLMGLVGALTEQTQAVNNGDMGRGEAMLAVQAHTLDAIFNALAQRAAINIGEYLDATDRYMRLALKAQSQCRATLETLATIKNPPMMGYVKQANIAHGPQQVNNGAAPISEPRARENENLQNKLLGVNDGERLDFETTSTASGADPAMATVGEIDRAKDTGR